MYVLLDIKRQSTTTPCHFTTVSQLRRLATQRL